MFEIAFDVSVERLKLIFPNEESRKEFLINDEQYNSKKWNVRKLTFNIEYLEKFRKRFPSYEYEVHFEKVGFLKTEAKSFSVWGAIVEREVAESQYFYNKLDEVDEQFNIKV